MTTSTTSTTSTTASIDFNNIPLSASFTQERIEQLCRSAAETEAAFMRKIEVLQETKTKAKENFDKEAKSIIDSASTLDRQIATQFAAKNIEHKLNELHRNLIMSSEKDRSTMLNGLQAYSEEAALLETLNKSPVMVLSRYALGDNKRTQYQMQLEGAGPVELETFAKQAIMSNDLILATAIATIIDRRPRKQQSFVLKNFAERMIGHVWKDTHAKLQNVQLAVKRALVADREFTRGKVNAYSKISLAMTQKSLQ